MEQVPGDIIILGVGGKIGPTLARLAKRAAPGKRVVGVARFSETGLREQPHGLGHRMHRGRSARPQTRSTALPKLANVVFMAGRKFGSSGARGPDLGDERACAGAGRRGFRGLAHRRLFDRLRVPLCRRAHGGATEATPATPPAGIYANSCVAREAMFQYFSRTRGTPGRIIRLNYAIDMRYGVLHDIATRVSPGSRSISRWATST